MQTTLRIDDDLYREAKAEAARQGTTLTRFLEEGLRLRLKRSPENAMSQPHAFPVYESESHLTFSDAELRRIDQEEQEQFYLRKLGLTPLKT